MNAYSIANLMGIFKRTGKKIQFTLIASMVTEPSPKRKTYFRC